MMQPEFTPNFAATFTDTASWIDALIQQFRDFMGMCEEAKRDMDEFIESSKGKYDKRQPYLHGWPRAPRRAVARGLSPVQCRYWVNYKARDKLPCTARKSPASATRPKGMRERKAGYARTIRSADAMRTRKASETGGQGHAEKQKAGAGGRHGRH